LAGRGNATGKTTGRALCFAQHRVPYRRGAVTIDHLWKYDVDSQVLKVDFFDKPEPERLRRDLVKRLERPGSQVTLAPQTETA
jgi:hypothetical protein